MEVTCEYKYAEWFRKMTYVCDISSGSITQPQTVITAIIGDHDRGKVDKNVEAINIKNLVVHFFPRGIIPNQFTNLRHFKLYNCGLKEIYRMDLSGMRNLRSVNFDQNKLKRLPDDLFVDTPRLEWVSFDNNELVCLSSKLLVPFEDNDLQRISLKNNPGINTYFVSKSSREYQRGHDDDRHSSLDDFKMKIDKSCKVERTMKKTKNHFDSFKALLESGSLSDIELEAGTETILAHKVVLASQSPVFASMFSAKKTMIAVKIKSCSSKSVNNLLEFIYTGEIERVYEVMDLFVLAVNFEIPKLKEFCENLIFNELLYSNAQQVLELGTLHNCSSLVRAATEKLRSEPEAGSEEEKGPKQESKPELKFEEISDSEEEKEIPIKKEPRKLEPKTSKETKKYAKRLQRPRK